MSKLTGPLLSLGASGSIGKTITYAVWRGIAYARQLVIPANPNTAGQQTTRNTFSTLASMWKILGTFARSPWTTFAQGQKFLDSNAFLGQNLSVVRGDADFQDFIGSPGAKGGLPMVSAAFATGTATGEVDITCVEPTLPTGWTITRAAAVAFPDQDPAIVFGGPLPDGEDLATPFSITLTGLGAAVLCVCAIWLEYVKPNGDTAYSVGISGTATSGA